MKLDIIATFPSILFYSISDFITVRQSFSLQNYLYILLHLYYFFHVIASHSSGVAIQNTQFVIQAITYCTNLQCNSEP